MSSLPHRRRPAPWAAAASGLCLLCGRVSAGVPSFAQHDPAKDGRDAHRRALWALAPPTPDPYFDRLGQRLPGPVFHNKLFLLGLQMSTTFDSDTDAFVDMFAVSSEVIAKPHYADGKTRCWPSPDSTAMFNLTRELKDTLLPWTEAVWLPLYCVVHGGDGKARRKQMEHVKLTSHDGNQDDSTLIWRCDVSGTVAKGRWKQRRRSATLRVSVVTYEWEVVTTVDLPINRGGAVGQYASRRPVRPLPAEKSATLCAAGVTRESYPYLKEFVLHHLAVGFGHVVLGISTGPGQPTMAETERLLLPEVLTGAVTLLPTMIPGLRCETNMMETLPFFHSCLYRAKGTSEFVASWEVGELFIPDKDDLSPGAAAAALRALETPGCDEWCYIRFPTYVARKPKEDYKRANRLGADFTLREAQPNEHFQRSISRTKTAHMAGLHVHGSCASARGGPRRQARYSVDGGSPGCTPRAVTAGSVRRFRLDDFERVSVADPNFVPDEYARVFYGRVATALDNAAAAATTAAAAAAAAAAAPAGGAG
ncbi:unnamed protein product [Phaeothamnion confervicola]